MSAVHSASSDTAIAANDVITNTWDGAFHLERGIEWFLLSKDLASGEVRPHPRAWKRGPLPNWWSRIGLRLLAPRYQRAWQRLAHVRLRAILRSEGLPPLAPATALVHTGTEFPDLAAVGAIVTGAPPAHRNRARRR